MSVLSKIIDKCKIAMKAGIPVIYIRTDSYQLIKDVVESEELVVLLSKNPKGFYRPYQEEKRKGNGAEPDNWNNDKWDSPNTWGCPHIVTIAVDDRSFAETELLQYVKNYMNDSDSPDKRSLTGFLRSSAVILYSNQIKVSGRLLQYCEVIEAGYPEFDEIRDIAQKMIEKAGQNINKRNMEQLCSLLQGFTIQEIGFALNKVLTRDTDGSSKDLLEEDFRNDKTGKNERKLAKDVRKIIQDQKKQRLQDGNQVLKLISPGDKKIGGMKELTEYIDWILEQRLLEDADQNKKMYGVHAPKGVLLCGIPGCGKSLAAKLTAQRLDLTLLQMDMGNLMGGIQGQSEENMRKALSQVEAMSPCVLWIDELEKGFSGVRSDGTSDGGTFKRMFATLLNWMQENTKPCFIFATANDIGGLPKELFRSGRFDELFGVFLPTAEECADIFVKHIQDVIDSTSRFREKAGLKQFITGKAVSSKRYLDIIDECLFEDGKVRIVIGSDIEKIVNSALAEFCQDIRDDEISLKEWEDTLRTEIRKATVYGDSPENIDSIAVGYCRMLRKGLRPTVKNPLFKMEDYHYERALKKRQEDNDSLPVILEKNVPCSFRKYDEAVYSMLYEKINEVAYDLERYERRKLVEG